MASNPRGFKHPIPGRAVSAESKPNIITPEQIMDACTPDAKAVQVRWHGLDLVVRSMIGVNEISDFVDLVLDMCWSGEYYRKEMMQFRMRFVVMLYYTNMKMPESDEDTYALLYGTDLYSTVKKCINADQLNEIEEALRMYLSK